MKASKLSAEQRDRIQIIRGLAIIAVVLIHSTPDFSPGVEIFFKPFVNFAVGTFLFLSGMLSDAASWNPCKRIRKVLVPYILWSLIYAIINYGFKKGIVPFLVLYAKYLLLGTGATMLYYIFVYCELTLLIPLIDRLARSKYRMLGFAISPLEIVLYRMIPMIIGINMHPYVHTIARVSCLGWFSYFYLGYLIGNGMIMPRCSKRQLSTVWMLSILLQFLEAYFYFMLGSKGAGGQLKLSAVLSGCIFCIGVYKYVFEAWYGMQNEGWLLCRTLRRVGDFSFGIFFCHIAIMKLLSLIPGINADRVFPLKAVLTVLCSFVFVKILHETGRCGRFLAC